MDITVQSYQGSTAVNLVIHCYRPCCSSAKAESPLCTTKLLPEMANNPSCFPVLFGYHADPGRVVGVGENHGWFRAGNGKKTGGS